MRKLTYIFVILSFLFWNAYAQKIGSLQSTGLLDSLPKLSTVNTFLDQTNSDTTKTPTPVTAPKDSSSKNVLRSSTLNRDNYTNVELNSGLNVIYTNQEINLNEVEFISNVLKVYNNETKPRAFYIDMALPAAWQLITKLDRYFTVKPKDTLFIPIRIAPRDFKKTSVNYTITTVLLSEEGSQIGDASFLAHTTKISKWELSVLPREKNYFLNKSNEVPFSMNIYNNGNTDQAILFYFKEIGKKAIINDENGNILNEKKKEFKFLPGEDTTLNFKFKAFKEKRNTQRIDIENHNPYLNSIEKKYSVIAFTKDAELNNKGGFVKSKRLSFIKLPNTTKMSQFGYASIPLIMDINVFNLIGRQPILNAVFRGSTMLEKGGAISYFFQNNFTSYYGRNFTKGSAFTLGYNKNKLNVNVGNVGSMGIGGMSFGTGGGRGINASYQINKHHRAGLYYTRGPQFFNSFFGTQSFGAFYFVNYRKIRGAASFGHLHNNVLDFKALSFGSNATYSITQKHSISAGFSGRYIYKTVQTTTSKLDYNVNLRYNGQINKLHREMLSIRYLNIEAVNPNRFRWNIIHRSQLKYFKKLPLNLNNNYSERLQFRRDGNGGYESIFTRYLANSVNSGFTLPNNSVISPNVFYNFIQLRSRWGHSRGIGFSYNFFNPETKLRFTYFAQGGYNFLPGLGTPNTFFFRTAAMTQFRTLTLNIRYGYGTGVMDTLNTFYTSKYPQTLGLNFSYQHAFRDERFVLIPFVNYNYVSVSNRHSFGIFPDFYFYSNTGWRFRLSIGSNFSFTEKINLSALVPTNSNNNNQNEEKWKLSSGLNVTIGVRKAFGIPIPKKLTKKRFASPVFICFYDFNGNKIYDSGELLIENVVVSIGETQVLSNEDGKCVIENIPAGKYKHIVFALEDLGTWYPVYEDSVNLIDQKKIFIPFVKGVKITGKVVMDREKFSSEVEKNIDLGKIKITATDSVGKAYTGLTNNKGEFELFVPYGKYTLNMDESILAGDRYRLLRNNYMVELKDGVDGIFHTFYIVERKRKLTKKKFGPDGKLMEETIEQKDKPKNPVPPKTLPDTTGNKKPLDPEKLKLDPKDYSPEELERMKAEFLKNTTPHTELKGTVFTVQLGAFALPVKPDAFAMVPEKLISERLPNGMIRISSGQFKTYKEAEDYQKLMYSLGYTAEDYIVAYLDGKYRNPAQTRKIK